MASPSIEWRTEIRPTYSMVVCSGEFCLKDGFRIFEAAFQCAVDHPLGRCMVDMNNIVGEPSVIERYQMGIHQAELQRLSRPGVKVVLWGREPLLDPRRLAQTVARNRGANIAVFTEFEEARAWLERD